MSNDTQELRARLSPELMAQVKQFAKETHRSVAKAAVVLLEKALKMEEEK